MVLLDSRMRGHENYVHLLSRTESRGASRIRLASSSTMDSLVKRWSLRFGGSFSDESAHGRRDISSHLPPLQVDKGIRNKGWAVDKAEVGITDPDAARVGIEGFGGRSGRSPTAELKIARRLEELSQLESPLLRELADRLSRMLRIETPGCAKNFEHPYTKEKVGQIWKEIQGCNNWAGLLEYDLNRKLKAEILRYGEFAQATYDAFDGDKKSDHYGTCKYAKEDLLEKVGLKNRGYEITTFLYATTDIFMTGTDDSKPVRGKAVPRNDETSHTRESLENGKKHTEDSKKDDIGTENCKECIDISEGKGNIESRNLHIAKCKKYAENSKQCNWIGFVAVCTSMEEIVRLGRRDMVIAWRGSKTNFDWVADFMNYQRPAGFGPNPASSKIRVEAGFRHLYVSTNPKSRYCKFLSAREQVKRAIEKFVEDHKHEQQLSITLTGHSLGSALAILCAYDIAECQLDLLQSDRTVSTDWRSQESHDEVQLRHGNGPGTCADIGGLPDNKFRRGRIPVTVFSFGGPKVGNQYFANRIEELGVAVLRVVNKRDKVPKLPGMMIHRHWKKLKNIIPDMGSYRHVGVKLKVDNELSPVLQKPAGPSRAHCLEAYLHLVDSYQGIKRDYRKGWIWNRRVCIKQSSTGYPKDSGQEKTLKQRILRVVFLQHRIALRFRESKYEEYKKTFRDHALVNKYKDFLKREYAIPANWWQEKNKGLVQNPDGEWRFPDRDESIPGTEEEAKKELERVIRAARDRSRPYENRRRGSRGLSRLSTMR